VSREFWINNTDGGKHRFWDATISDDPKCVTEYGDFSEALHVIDYATHEKYVKALKVCRQSFADLVRDCKWYAEGNGTEQERHHFLAVEAQGNYLDLAEAEIEGVLK